MTFLPDLRILAWSRDDQQPGDGGSASADTFGARRTDRIREDDWQDARMRLDVAQARYQALRDATADPASVADATEALLAARARIEDLRRAHPSGLVTLD